MQREKNIQDTQKEVKKKEIEGVVKEEAEEAGGRGE
jgi:hypothetical protein